MTTKNVLVTGGVGFIGSHLCEELLDQGHAVTAFDNMSTGNRQNILTHKNYTFVQGDANRFDDLHPLFKDHTFDWVFHYAAVVGVKRTMEQPALVIQDVMGIKHILDLAVKHHTKKVLFASSSEIYGEPTKTPEEEDGPIDPRTPYAAVKLFGEQSLRAYYEQHGLKTTSLRLFNVYGPRQISTAYGFVVGVFINQVLQNKNPTIFGDGKQTRDFVYVKDNVHMTIAAMESAETNGEAINLGVGKPATILHLAQEIIKLSGRKLKPEFLSPRTGDIIHRYPSVERMKKLIGYDIKYSLEQGLKETFDWFSTRQ